MSTQQKTKFTQKMRDNMIRQISMPLPLPMICESIEVSQELLISELLSLQQDITKALATATVPIISKKITNKNSGLGWDSRVKTLILADYKNGILMKDLQIKYQRSKSSLASVLVDNIVLEKETVKAEKMVTWSKVDLQSIKDLYEKGTNLKEISDSVNRSQRSVVMQLLKVNVYKFK